MAAKPRAEIRFKNTKVDGKFLNQINREWFRYLEENPTALLKKGKKYKIDQKCIYEFSLDEKNFLELESLKIFKQKNKDNFDFNLAAIDFLKRYYLELKQKDQKKPMRIEFLYYAF